MVLKNGWVSIIVGVVLLGFLVWMWLGFESSINEMNNIRENGYAYEGTSEITQEQFNEIKKYDGFHGGTIEIITLEPLTVEYHFPSLNDYGYLVKERWSFTEKSKAGLTDVILMVAFAIPVFYIVNGCMQLGNRNKVK